MANAFAEQDWAKINERLHQQPDAFYGLPDRRPGSLIFASWNIREFGAEFKSDGEPRRSSGAYRLIESFCRRCDFLAVQEVQENLWSVRNLRDRLNELEPSSDYKLIASDVTGLTPGYTGSPERFAYLYDSNRIQFAEIASDLTLDRTAVVDNVNEAIKKIKNEVLEEDGEKDGMAARVLAWLKSFMGLDRDKLPTFIEFIRSPHMVTFSVKGDGAQHSYELACINAHLVSGRGIDREREFFALLEWLVLQSKNEARMAAPIVILLADLNLDFDSSNPARKRAIEELVANLNNNRLRDSAKINFPFLDPHPVNGEFRTNARQDETYDHIAFLTRDNRLPRAHQNNSAGQLGPDDFDYGIFNFVRLFQDSIPEITVSDALTYDKFEWDVSDHMPIWIRLPIPNANQHRFLDVS